MYYVKDNCENRVIQMLVCSRVHKFKLFQGTYYNDADYFTTKFKFLKYEFADKILKCHKKVLLPYCRIFSLQMLQNVQSKLKFVCHAHG